MSQQVDSLDIKISATASNAEKSIDRLISKLNTLSTSIAGIDGSALSGFANSVNKLGSAVKSLSGIKTSDFTRIAKGFEKFSKIDTTGMARAAGGINMLATSMSAFANMPNMPDITSFINAIKNLSRADMSGFDANKLNAMATSIADFATRLSGVGKIESGITRLISAMARLSSSGQYISNVVAYFPMLSTQVINFVSAMSTAGTVDANITKLVDGIARLASAGAKTKETAENLEKLGDGVLNLLRKLQNAPQISTNIANTVQGLGNLAASGNRISTVSNAATNATSKFGSALRSLGTRTKSAKLEAGTLARAIGKLYQKYFLLWRMFKGLGKAIVGTTDYIEAWNYYSVAFGKIGSEWGKDYQKYGYENAETYAKSFSDRVQEKLNKMSGLSVDIDKGLLSASTEKNLGLNIQEITQYASQLASVTNSLGQTGEATTAITKSMTMLAGDISSLFNVDYKTVAQNLQSGLIGQSRALYKYGIDITNATLAQYAYNYGISKSVSEMSQAEKQQLRVLAILDQSKVSWGDLANTINSPSNMLRQFKTNLSETGMVLGQIFIPLLQKVMPVINGITIALKRLFVQLASFMGVEIDFESFGQSGYKDTVDGLEDVSDAYTDVADSAKEAQNSLMGFDKINKLNDDTNGNKSDSSGNKNPIDLTDEIKKASEEYEKAWNEALDKMENKSTEVANRIVKAFGDAYKTGDFSGIGSYISTGIRDSLSTIDWDSVYSGASGFGKGVATFLNGLIDPSTFAVIGETVAGCVNTALCSTESFADNLDWDNVGTSIASGINGAIRNVKWKKMIKTGGKLGKGLAKALNSAIKKTDFKGIGTSVADILNTAVNFAFNLVTTFDFPQAGDQIANMINGFFSEFDAKKSAKTLSGFAKGLLKAINRTLKKTNWKKVGTKIGDFLANLDWGEILIEAGKAILGGINAAMDIAAGIISSAPIESGIIAALALAKFTGLGETLKTSLSPVIQDGIDKTGAVKYAMAITVAVEAVKVAQSKMQPIFDEYSMEEIKDASERMFTDWFGDNPISVTLSDMFVVTATAICEPSEITSALSDMWDDVCSGDFKFNFLNLFELPSYNEMEDYFGEQWSDFKYLLTHGHLPPKKKSHKGGSTDGNENGGNGREFSNELKEAGEEAGKAYTDGIKSGMVKGSANSKTTAKTVANNINSNINNKFAIKNGESKKTLSVGNAITNGIKKGTLNELISSSTKYEFGRIPTILGSHIGDMSKKFNGKGTQVVAGIKNGADAGSKSTATKYFFKTSLPNTLNKIISNKEFGMKFAPKGHATVTGIKNGANAEAVTEPIKNFFSKILPAKLSNATSRKEIIQRFTTKGAAIVAGIRSGAKTDSKSDTSKNFLSNTLPSKLSSSTSRKNFVELFTTKGNAIVAGIKNGARNDSSSGDTKNYMSNELPSTLANGMGNISSKFNASGANIINGLENGAKGQWSTGASWVKNIGSTIQNTANMYDVGKNMGESLASGMANSRKVNFKIDLLNKATMSDSQKQINEMLGLDGLQYGFGFYAGGGFPNTGEVFVAREAGAEMVGRINGRTAVANNDQIVNAVSKGVYEAVVSAMNKSSNNVNIYLEGEARGLFRAVQKESHDYTRRTGKPAFN